MIDDVKRIAGPYTGAGQAAFPFGFKIFEAEDVNVFLAEGPSAAPGQLRIGENFTVEMNADQEATPGGTVTLRAALTGEQVLSIVSGLPYTQIVQLTNYSRFPPQIINDGLDRVVIQVQQLRDELSRAVKVSATDSTTPEELKQRLLDAAETATVVAKGYADQAKTSADEAKAARDEVVAKKDDVIAEIEAEGKSQVERVKAAADDQLVLESLGGAEVAWTLSAPVTAGTPITIPDGHTYVVGRHHLRISWNGVTLHIGTGFSEIGTQDAPSSTFTLSFDAGEGDELDAWIAPLGRKDATDAVIAAGAAQEAVAELSRKVVYKNQESAE